MVICITLFSCKKNDEPKIVTLDEMKVIMFNSSELKLLFESNEKVYNLKQKLYFENIGSVKGFRKTESTNSQIVDINSLKTRVELVNYVNKTSNYNGEIIVTEIEKQQKMLSHFLIKNPSIKNFTKTQVNDLLKTAFESYRNSKNNLLLQNFNLIKEVNDCMGSFNLAYNTCDNNYNWTMIGIWTGVLLTAGETAGASLAVGLIGTIVAEAILDDCLYNASANFSMCTD
jgi:hypothetical protein